MIAEKGVDLPPEPSWRLYVDETGDFRDRAEAVVVAGLLIAEALARRQEAFSTVTLRNVARDFPRPLHAAHLNQPLLVALTHRLFGHPKLHDMASARAAAPCATCTHADRAVAVIRSASSDHAGRLEALLTSLWNGEKIRLGLVRELAREVEARAPDTFSRLRDTSRGNLATLRREIQRLAGASSRSSVISFRMAIVVSSEGEIGDANPRDGGPPRVDRYGRLLDSLLSRCANVLVRQGQTAATVLVRAQERGLDLGTPPFESFTIADLEAAIERSRASMDGEVNLVAVGVDRFDENASVYDIIADYVAFRSYGPFQRSDEEGTTPTLAAIEFSLFRGTSLPSRSGEPGKSHVAATGWPERAISAARQGDAFGDAPPGVAAWAVEQALEWAKP